MRSDCRWYYRWLYKNTDAISCIHPEVGTHPYSLNFQMLFGEPDKCDGCPEYELPKPKRRKLKKAIKRLIEESA